MAHGIGRLLSSVTRRRSREDRQTEDRRAIEVDPASLDDAPVGPPMLMPAAIIRQVLFDSSEFTPAWARPRQAPVPASALSPTPATTVDEPPAEPVAAADQPKPAKRPRRAKATESPAPKTPESKPRRARKPPRDRTTEP